MKRLLFFATLAAFVTGVFAALAPADGPVNTTASQVSYEFQWRAGATPTVTQFVGTTPSLPTTPTSPDQATSCVITLASPQKVVYQGVWIYENATGSCTSDVYSITGTDDLYRGITQGPYLIGSDAEHADGNLITWGPSGTCHSSTWAYWAYIPSIHVCSNVNGCAYLEGGTSPVHYWTC